MTVLLGMVAVVKKKWWGHLIGFGAQILWIIFGITTGYYGIIVVNIFFCGISVWGIYEWRNENNEILRGVLSD